MFCWRKNIFKIIYQDHDEFFGTDAYFPTNFNTFPDAIKKLFIKSAQIFEYF